MQVFKKLPSASRVLVALAVAVLTTGTAWNALHAEGPAQPLVRGMVDDTVRVTLAGNVHPLARPQFDLGPVEDSFAAERLLLILKRSPAQEQALAQFLQEAHTPGSAAYHQWLTPQAFGERFGAADSDLAAVTAWLESHGFSVNMVHPGRIAIEFSGSAAQVKAAFHTEIHRYGIPNASTGERETHYANASNPQIPSAFAALIAGISPMNSFHAQPPIQVRGRATYNVKTHRSKASWTYAADTFELAPGDFAVQYDIASVYKGGTTGLGVGIGIVSESNVDLSLVQAYQKLFGLTPNVPSVVVDGNDPGQNSAATEAYLDLEQSGAVAPGANVVLYTSAGSELTDPLLTSALRAIDDNQVSVISMSYEACEAALGASGNALWSEAWQQATAQGITPFVAAGDGGSAGCDNFDTEGYAYEGLAVNGFASTPFNVSVGGTDFYFSDYAAGGSALNTQLGSYWSPISSNSPMVSLLKTAPEQVWNQAFGYNTIDGGSYNTLVADYGSSIVAGGGGASSAALYPSSATAVGYPKPGWQTGTGVPADKVRDLPDLALFASDGANDVGYPICASPGDCVNMTVAGSVQITSVGGTSAAAPAMAGIQALVDQATKSRQGQANYVYYALASKTLAAKPFRDVTVGGNEVPCEAGSANCALGASGQTNGNYAETGYAAAVGYDRASGLGTVDVANLIANWSAVAFKPTKTTLTVTPATFAHGTAATVKTTVAPATGAGTPTGSVGLMSNDTVAYSNSLGVLPLTGGAGSVSLDTLPGGTYQVTGDYSGDGTYSPSASAPVTVTVTPEKDTLATYGWVLNPIDNNVYPLVAGMEIPYGSNVYLDAVPVGVNEATPALGAITPATGAITFTDKGPTTKSAAVPLNDEGVAEWIPASLAVGSHTVNEAYTGDASYLASTAASAATITVFKGNTSIYVQPVIPPNLPSNVTPSFVVAGSNVTVDVLIYSGYLNLNGTLPTGTLTVTLGGQTLTVTSPFKTWGPAGSAYEEAVVTFAKVPAGLLPLTASYSGDANWYGTSSLYGTVQSLATLPAPSVTLTAATTAYTPGQTVTMTGTVAGTAGGKAPSGYLYFTWEDSGAYYYETLQSMTANSSTFTLTFPANNLANGTNTFVAAFEGDSNYSWQSSAPLYITFAASDFSMITTTQEVAVAPGKTGTGSVWISPLNAYSGTVAITCSAPTGITCKPANAAPTVGTGVADALALTVANTVSAGTYPVIVTATGGGHTHTAEILVGVN